MGIFDVIAEKIESVLNPIYVLLDKLGIISGDVGGIFSDFSSFTANLNGIVQGVLNLVVILAIIVAAIIVIVIVVGLLVIVISILLAGYFLNAIPVFTVAKKAKCKQAWMAWIPIFQFQICTFVLSKVSGKETFDMFGGSVKIKDESIVMMVYAMIYAVSNIFCPVICFILSLIPAIGVPVAMGLQFVVQCICLIPLGIIQYTYLRDTISVFKPKPVTNAIHAALITILDAVLTEGAARAVYLITMMRLKPIDNDESVIIIEDQIEGDSAEQIEGDAVELIQGDTIELIEVEGVESADEPVESAGDEAQSPLQENPTPAE